jgi:GTP-binding protein EngB required for normal cell division
MKTTDKNKSMETKHSHEVYARIDGGMDEIGPDSSKLKDYTQTRLALAGQLRIVRESLATLGREKAERQYGELMVKLAEDRFTLAVMGQFNRGKSSLMNAIIGNELLPVGVLPTTSTITVLRYGPKERLIINRENSFFPEELPVSSLAEYVTETGNPGNIKKVKTACVEVPVSFLRDGIEFVDTPGVGSSILSNTVTTLDFLSECDAVLFLTGIDTPMTTTELDFLKYIRKYVHKVFFIINKIDLVADHDRGKVMKFVADTISKQTGSESLRIFHLSAKMALAAKMTGDPILCQLSGLKSLEDNLAAFLSAEKSSVFLAGVSHRALSILNNEVKLDAFGATAIEARQREIQEGKNIAIHNNPRAAVASLIMARAKLKLLYEEITHSRISETEDIEIRLPSMEEENVKPESENSTDDMVADFLSRGCPVCKHIIDCASNFFMNWQYKISSEEYSQNAFANELGFCPLHTWQLLAVCSPHGASVGFATLTEKVASYLREGDIVSMGGKYVQKLVRGTHNCRICEMLRTSESEYVRRLSVIVSEASGRDKYHLSQGVCLRHLGMLIDEVRSVEIRRFLICKASQHFEDEAQEMRSFAIKHEALRKDLQNSDEQDAYRRAIIHIVGDKGVYTPWPEDKEI